MTWRRAKADDNQPEIVAALRAAHFSVQHLHMVGGGCPDILVGGRVWIPAPRWIRYNWLQEIKDGRKVPSERRLTGDEPGWHERWKGQLAVVLPVVRLAVRFSRRLGLVLDLLEGADTGYGGDGVAGRRLQYGDALGRSAHAADLGQVGPEHLGLLGNDVDLFAVIDDLSRRDDPGLLPDVERLDSDPAPSLGPV